VQNLVPTGYFVITWAEFAVFPGHETPRTQSIYPYETTPRKHREGEISPLHDIIYNVGLQPILKRRSLVEEDALNRQFTQIDGTQMSSSCVLRG